jgi:hypothetical protein
MFSHTMQLVELHACQMAMSILTKFTGTAAIILSAYWVCSVLMAISARYSLAYWFVLSAAALPVIFWKGLGFRRWSPAALAVAIRLAASPIDFKIQSGQLGLQILPVSHGITCEEGTACYGCVKFGTEPSHAIVLSF